MIIRTNATPREMAVLIANSKEQNEQKPIKNVKKQKRSSRKAVVVETPVVKIIEDKVDELTEMEKLLIANEE